MESDIPFELEQCRARMRELERELADARGEPMPEEPERPAYEAAAEIEPEQPPEETAGERAAQPPREEPEQPREETAGGIGIDVLDRKALEKLPGLVYLLDLADLRTTFLTRDVVEQLGYHAGQLDPAQAWLRLLHPHDGLNLEDLLERLRRAREDEVVESEQRLMAADGEWRWMRVRYRIFERDTKGEPSRALALAEDVSREKQDEDSVKRMSLMDDLTGLYNRRGFFSFAPHQLRSAGRLGKRVLLLFADLDGLKRINDEHGHPAGDRALEHLAEAMRDTFRESDMLSRLGGDEFAVLAMHNAEEDIPLILDRLRTEIEKHSRDAESQFRLSVSIGTSEFDPERGGSLEQLIENADRRMYEQKQRKLRADA